MYTSIAKVREYSGFLDSTLVSDAFILRQITRAEGMIDGYVSGTYQLPLPYFWQNTITFSGTGSTTGTMTIVINSISYAIAVTSGMTAAQAADAFRRAIAAAGASATFQFDSVSSAVVTLTADNQLKAIADVTLTSTDPQTVAGITATGGTPVAVSSGYIEYLATEIATCYILLTEYGAEAQDSDKDGAKRLAMVEEELEKIRDKKMKLFDASGNEFTVRSSSRLKFYPNDASEEDSENPTPSRFTMNQKF